MKKRFADLAAAFSDTSLPPVILAHDTGRISSQWISNYQCEDTGKKVVLSSVADPISPLTGGNAKQVPRAKDRKITAAELASLTVLAVLPDGTTLRSSPELANALDGHKIYSPISGMPLVVNLETAQAEYDEAVAEADEEADDEDDLDIEEADLDADDEDENIEDEEDDVDAEEADLDVDDDEEVGDEEDDTDNDAEEAEFDEEDIDLDEANFEFEESEDDDDEEDDTDLDADDEEDEGDDEEDDEEDEMEDEGDDEEDDTDLDAGGEDDENMDDEEDDISLDGDDEDEEDEDDDEEDDDEMEDDEDEDGDDEEESSDLIADDLADEDDVIETTVAETASLNNIEVVNTNGRFWVIAGQTPVATVDVEKCQPLQRKMLDKDHTTFARALDSSIQTAKGMTGEIATAFGLDLLRHEIPVAKAVADKIRAETASAVKNAKDEGKKYTKRFELALSTAMAGINKGVFEDVKSHPLKSELVAALASSGVRNPEKVVKAAFEKGSEKFLRLVLAKALKLASESDEFVGQTAKFVSKTRNPEFASAEDDSDDFGDKLSVGGHVVEDRETEVASSRETGKPLSALRTYLTSSGRR